MWRVAANILNKQSRTAGKGWSFSLDVNEVLATPHLKNLTMLRKRYMSLRRAVVNAVMNIWLP
jgi:hypothetical protein